MRRGYSRESYLQLVREIRSRMPTVALSSDFISGFCGETDQDHQDTVIAMNSERFLSFFLRFLFFCFIFFFFFSCRCFEKWFSIRRSCLRIRFERKRTRIETIRTEHSKFCSCIISLRLYSPPSDDVPPEVKNQRLKEVIDTFHELAKAKNQKEIGTEHIVLVEGVWKLSCSFLCALLC